LAELPNFRHTFGKTDVVLADGSAKSAAMLATGLPPPISPNPVHFKGETRF